MNTLTDWVDSFSMTIALVFLWSLISIVHDVAGWPTVPVMLDDLQRASFLNDIL